MIPFIAEKINEKQSVYSDVSQNIQVEDVKQNVPLKNEILHKIALTTPATERKTKQQRRYRLVLY